MKGKFEQWWLTINQYQQNKQLMYLSPQINKH